MFRFVAEGQVRLVALVDLKGQLTDETCLFAFLTLWRRHNEVELQPAVISKPKLTECLHREHNATSTSSRCTGCIVQVHGLKVLEPKT